MGTVLVLGGQRSGKSRYGEGLVRASGREPVIIATATAGDDEMRARIAAHRASRGPAWVTIEEPLDLAGALDKALRPESAVLVDCLTLWLSNVVLADRDVSLEIERLVRALAAPAGPAVVISNEVGSGIVPANALARRYSDALGVLNQRVAGVAGQVILMTAGIPSLIKPAAAPEVRL